MAYLKNFQEHFKGSRGILTIFFKHFQGPSEKYPLYFNENKVIWQETSQEYFKGLPKNIRFLYILNDLLSKCRGSQKMLSRTF